MRVLAHLREWSGVLALALVLAGGTAYAANEWTGTNIVNESLTGLDIKAETVKGADVLESSLAKVGDADKLDNLDSARFVQGGAAVPGAFGVSQAKAYFNRVTSTAGAGESTFLEIPGLLHLRMDCTAGNAIVDVISDQDGLEAYTNWSGNGLVQRYILDQGDVVGFAAGASERTHRLELQAGTGENTFGLQDAVDVTVSFYYTPAGDCRAQASAIAQGT
jgi:hypothetical protein